MSLQNVRRGADVLKAAARAARDDPLIHMEFSISHLIHEGIFHRPVQADQSLLLHIVKDILQIFVQLFDGIGVAGMEGHGDHGPDLRQVKHDHSVIIGGLSGSQLLIFVLPAVDLIEILDLIVRRPDGGQAGGLRGHHVDADPEIGA